MKKTQILKISQSKISHTNYNQNWQIPDFDYSTQDNNASFVASNKTNTIKKEALLSYAYHNHDFMSQDEYIRMMKHLKLNYGRDLDPQVEDKAIIQSKGQGETISANDHIRIVRNNAIFTPTIQNSSYKISNNKEDALTNAGQAFGLSAKEVAHIIALATAHTNDSNNSEPKANDKVLLKNTSTCIVTSSYQKAQEYHQVLENNDNTYNEPNTDRGSNTVITQHTVVFNRTPQYKPQIKAPQLEEDEYNSSSDSYHTSALPPFVDKPGNYVPCLEPVQEKQDKSTNDTPASLEKVESIEVAPHSTSKIENVAQNENDNKDEPVVALEQNTDNNATLSTIISHDDKLVSFSHNDTQDRVSEKSQNKVIISNNNRLVDLKEQVNQEQEQAPSPNSTIITKKANIVNNDPDSIVKDDSWKHFSSSANENLNPQENTINPLAGVSADTDLVSDNVDISNAATSVGSTKEQDTLVDSLITKALSSTSDEINDISKANLYDEHINIKPKEQNIELKENTKHNTTTNSNDANNSRRRGRRGGRRQNK